MTFKSAVRAGRFPLFTLQSSVSSNKGVDFVRKKYRPPRPIGVKGGCSPQNNRGKLSSLVIELQGSCNKILRPGDTQTMHTRQHSKTSNT